MYDISYPYVVIQVYYTLAYLNYTPIHPLTITRDQLMWPEHWLDLKSVGPVP